MSDIDLQAKIREALTATNGNRHDAQQLLITWAVRDHQLLLSMTKKHLKAIATGLIDYVERPQTDNKMQTETKLSQNTVNNILSHPEDQRLIHDKRRRANLPPPKSTETQASTMRRLAESYARKRDET